MPAEDTPPDAISMLAQQVQDELLKMVAVCDPESKK